MELVRIRWAAAITVTLGLLAQSPALALAAQAPHVAGGPGPFGLSARGDEPVILTGAQIPTWSQSPATGTPNAYPSGASKSTGGDGTRSAHNGVLAVPPADTRTGVNPDDVTAFRWTAAGWVEIPVQVDQKFPYHLANGHSSFSFYSGTDQELTYAWNPTAHATAEEAWKKVFGDCFARYQLPGTAGQAELAAAIASGAVSPNPTPKAGQPVDDYTQAMPDPVHNFNDDDELVFMAGDAGGQAPVNTPPPPGTTAGNGQVVTVIDPTAASGPGWVYLFTRPGGSSYNSTNGYVQMARDANADEWIDRYSFAPSSTEKIGTSNTGYGPNIPGTVCRTAAGNDSGTPAVHNAPDGTSRASSDRVPRDGVTVTTPKYRVYASGRWMVRQFNITAPTTDYNYGPNLISRWKGRAFQQSPDSTVSVVGFEDEQVNWEANAAVLGWKQGPVRAIREIWGADSGTNVTKTETYYRSADVYHYHVRVHPIPPDGLYTSWDYRIGAIDHYYNQVKTAGVPVDGINDNLTHVDQVPVSGQAAFVDSCDPTFNDCSALDNPEEWAGPNGGMVYVAEMVGASTAANPAVVPYYRDDACLDDGTDDGPPPRPWPGDNHTDARVQQGYVDYWKAHGAPSTLTYADLVCNPADTNTADPMWKKFPFAGAIGQGGLHFFVTGDSDNTFSPAVTDEIDAQQWRYSVPMSVATNVIPQYGNNVVLPLRTVVVPFAQSPLAANVPEVPATALLLLAALPALIHLRRRRRRES